MKFLYDTSVIVPALLTNHTNHSIAFPQLEVSKREGIRGYISAHSLAEVYSVTTRLPKPLKISSDEAKAAIARLLEYLLPVELSVKDYWQAIAKISSLQLTGGVTYDALIAQAALKAKVNRLITLNPKDFNRLGDDISGLVYVPELGSMIEPLENE